MVFDQEGRKKGPKTWKTALLGRAVRSTAWTTLIQHIDCARRLGTVRDGRRREIERGARGKRRSGKRTRDTSKTKPHAAVNYRGCRLRIYLFPRCFFRRDRSQDPLLEEISLASSSPGLPADADPETADTRTTGVNCRSDKRGESTAFGRREIGGTGGWRSRIEREACRSIDAHPSLDLVTNTESHLRP